MNTQAPTYLYKPTWVANNFLQLGKKDKIKIDPLKIQKLVYNFHGWHLAVTARPAVGERFEAWPMGPVLSSLYHQFKKYRRNSISEPAKDINPVTGDLEASYVQVADEQFGMILRGVWNRYKEKTGVELSALTHAPGTPWSKARDGGQQYILDDDIRSHFVELARN